MRNVTSCICHLFNKTLINWLNIMQEGDQLKASNTRQKNKNWTKNEWINKNMQRGREGERERGREERRKIRALTRNCKIDMEREEQKAKLIWQGCWHNERGLIGYRRQVLLLTKRQRSFALQGHTEGSSDKGGSCVYTGRRASKGMHSNDVTAFPRRHEE